MGDIPPSCVSGRWLDRANQLAEWAGQRLGDLTGDPPEANRFAALAAAIECHFGVDVMVESLGEDGPLGMSLTDPEFPFILINADMIRPRAMFTLAHELGHVLAIDGSEIKIDEDLRGNNGEERLANAFAAALLIPQQGALGDTEEPAMLLAARERPSREPPVHLTTRCISGIWDGTISAAPLAGLLDVETDELVEKLSKAWETADAFTEDYSTLKDSPDVVS